MHIAPFAQAKIRDELRAARLDLPPMGKLLRELRVDNPHVTWEDVEAQYEKEHPRELTKIELIHQEFSSKVPHPELHGGKKAKNVWAQLEDSGASFLEFVEKHHLEHEEGNLFSYLVRVMNFAGKLYQVSQLSELEEMAAKTQAVLADASAKFYAG